MKDKQAKINALVYELLSSLVFSGIATKESAEKLTEIEELIEYDEEDSE